MHTQRLLSVGILLATTTLSLISATTAQTAWSQLPLATFPSKRSEYDIARAPGNQIYLFGGRAAAGYLNDTWKWDGKTWTRIVTKTTPSPRSGHCMTYDILRKKVIMFSGWNGGRYLPETWEFDGQDWKNVSPATQPGARDWSAMAYDLRSLKTILFGGHDWQRAAYGDTWAWDGKVWTRLSPKTNPSARTGHRLVFDANVGSVVLVGAGKNGPDLWSWSGKDWSQIVTKTRPGYAWMLAAAFDEHRRRLVVYHGTKTWEFNGKDWALRLSAGGPGGNFIPAFYDGVRQQVGVFGAALGGNRSTPSDKMVFYGATRPAGYTAFGTGCKGSNGRTPTLSATDPWIGESFTMSVANLPNTGSVFFYIGLSKSKWGALNLPFDLGLIGAPGCKLYTDPVFLVPLANRGGRAQWVVTLPSTNAIVGQSFFNQAWGADARANSLGVTVSNAGEGRFGSK